MVSKNEGTGVWPVPLYLSNKNICVIIIAYRAIFGQTVVHVVRLLTFAYISSYDT